MALQFIRGLDADRLNLTPAVGEPLFTTDTKRFYIGDGSTVGGVEVTGTDSATVIALIQQTTLDSASIISLINAYNTDSAEITAIVNPLYIQARQSYNATTLGGHDSDYYLDYTNFTNTPSNVSEFSNDAGYITAADALDSVETIALVDSSYVQARQTPQDFAYSSLTGAPTNVSSFTNDAGYTTYDSANAAGQITSAIDALIAGAPGALDTLNELAAALGDDANFATTVTNAIAALPDSAEVATIVTDIVDSAYITARTPPSLTIREVDSADNVNKTINSVSAINFDNWTGFQVTDLGGGEVKVALGSGFKTITVDGQDNIVAIGEDTLAIDAGTNVTLATDAATKTLTISATFDSAEVTDIVDSAYIQARIPEIPSVTVSGTAPSSPAEGDLWYDNVTTGQLYTYVGTSWLSTAGLTTLQFSSVGDLSDVDITTAAPTNGQFLAWDSANSKFIPGSETPQDFAYSSLTGAPTNVSSFTNDAGYITAADALDSAETQALIDAAVAALVDTAPATLDTLNELAAALGDDANFATTVTNAIAALPDSAEVATIVTSYGYATQTYVDGAVAALPDSSEVQAIATTLVDSAYVQARQTPQDFAYSSLTGAPTNVSSFTNDANYLDSNTVTGVIDATYINSLVTATDSAAVINIVTDTVDSAYVTARIPEIPSVTVSGTAPASPTEGDLWYDNVTTGQLYTYVGTSWLSTAGLTTLQFSSIADLADVDSSAPTDGQYLTWNSATSQYVPTTLDAGTDSATVASIVTSTIDSSYTITGDVDNTNITTYFLNYKDTGYQILADEGGWLYIKGTNTDQDIIVRTNASGSGENDFVFGKDASLTLPGSLVFQDATVQTTAYNTVAVTADINNVVDSAYVQSRQDFDYNSLINVPANVSDFSNDANYIATGDSAALASLTTTGNVVIGGNLQVNGTTVTVNTTDLDVTDNMIYMNAGESAGSPTASIDVGWAANVNDQGSYYHVGLFRDATDQTFKVYHQYTPEPDAAVQINTGDASFALAPFAASTLTGKYLGFDSDVTAAGLATQTYVTSTIDSAYINARVSATDSAAVISIITDTVDSAYVNGLVTIPSGVTVSGTAPASPAEGDLWYDDTTTGELFVYENGSWTSTGIPPSIGSIGELGDVDVYTTPPTNGQVLLWDSATSNFIPGTVETGTDSAAIVSLIDSAYVQARQAAQDFAYSSLTGAPTNVSSFTNDAGYLTTAIDSTGVTSLIDAAVAALVDTAPSTLDTLNELAAALGDDANFATTVTNAIAALPDSAEVAAIIQSYGYTTYDSSNTLALVDSSYVQSRQTAQDFAYASLTGTPTNVSSFTNDANYLDSSTVAGVIDSAYINGLVTIPSGVTVSGTAPALPTEGDLWYDNVTTGQLYTYVGTSWLSTAGLTTLQFSSIADLSDVDSSAPTEGQYLAWNSATSQYVPTTLAAGTDSGTVVGIVTSTVDSAYVQLRQTPQDFAYSSLTGAPTNVSSFTNDAGYLTSAIDSTGVTSLIDAAVAALVDTAPATLDTLNELAAALGDDANFATTVTTAIAAKLDSAQTIALIDSAYINARVSATDSAAVITIITDTVDSAYIQARTDAVGLMFRQFTYTADSGDTTFSGTDDNGSTLTYVAGKIEVFYNGVLLSPADYTATDGTTIVFDNPVDSADTVIVSSYTTTTLLDSAAIINLATGVIDSAYINARVSATDSATVISLVTDTVDSAYVQARQTAQDFAYSSLTGAPTNVSSFTNDAGYLTSAIDSTGVTSLIDAAVAALVDTAPATLDTLNELAAALGDDANFATTVTNAIAAKLDSAQTLALIDSAYVNSLVTTGTDSATVVTLITQTVDSAYVAARVDNVSVDSAFVLGLVGASVSGVSTYEYTATASQTTFSGTDDNGATLAYTAGNILVHRNGILIVSTVDYVATNGTSVVLQSAADSGDTISVIAYQPTLVNASETTITSDVQTATSGQTSFTVEHTQGQILVFLNGILLKDTDDYVSNGSTVVLTQSADSGDQITVHNFAKYSAAGSGGGTNTSAVYAYSILFGA